jgi:hypothetical protein
LNGFSPRPIVSPALRQAGEFRFAYHNHFAGLLPVTRSGSRQKLRELCIAYNPHRAAPSGSENPAHRMQVTDIGGEHGTTATEALGEICFYVGGIRAARCLRLECSTAIVVSFKTSRHRQKNALAKIFTQLAKKSTRI